MTHEFIETIIKNFPDSIRSMLSSAAISGAVHHLASVKKDGLVEGLAWDELVPFLEARAAAHLTRAEYPIAMWNSWEAIWGRKLTELEWEPLSIDDVGNDAIGPKAMWDNECITMHHTHKEKVFDLYTLVELSSNRTAIGFALEKADVPQISGSKSSFKWEGLDSSYEGYMIASWDCAITDQEFKLDVLLAARNEALDWVASAQQ